MAEQVAHPPATQHSAARRRLLVTGGYSAAEAVLALPALAGLRQKNPDDHITFFAPAQASELAGRLKLAHAIWRLEDKSAPRWLWQRWRGRFDGTISAEQLWEGAFHRPDFSVLQGDLSFMAPPAPYVLLTPISGFSLSRMAGMARKLVTLGYGVGVVSEKPGQMQALTRAAGCRDLTSGVGATEMAILGPQAVSVIGGAGALTYAAALAGARTVIVCAAPDARALRVLPPDTTVFLASDDPTQVTVGDILKAADIT